MNVVLGGKMKSFSLVLGANGHLGNNLVREPLKEKMGSLNENTV
jgi:hypothetical protein